MIDNNKYREIKITYIHIITLIIAFIAIGLLLFFLGYRIGKGSVEQSNTSPEGKSIDRKIVRVNANENKINPKKNKEVKSKKNKFTSEIDKELQMHNTIGMQNSDKNKKKIKAAKEDTSKLIESKRIKRTTYYAIQIGAFRDHKGAKKEAQRFSKTYSSEIVKSGDLYKVRIGSYKTENRAKQEIKNNPKLKGCYTVKIKRWIYFTSLAQL